MMEGMNGVQFATRVRAMEAYRQVPLIFVTGLTDFRDRLGAIADLRIDVIAKPFLIIELATKALSLRLSTAREAGQISAFTAS
jgi:DNA-binding response OmpR family regulator